MSSYFIDTSGLVKQYVTEVGTKWVESLIAPAARNSIYIAGITFVEVIAAITRRRNTGSISAIDASNAIQQFRIDFTFQFDIVEITESILEDAADNAEQYSLRAYDAVQLAAIVKLTNQHLANGFQPVTLVSSDLDLNTAAATLGIPVEDPNNHP